MFTNKGTVNECLPVFDKVERIEESVTSESRRSAGTPPIAYTKGAVTGCNLPELLRSGG